MERRRNWDKQKKGLWNRNRTDRWIYINRIFLSLKMFFLNVSKISWVPTNISWSSVGYLDTQRLSIYSTLLYLPTYLPVYVPIPTYTYLPSCLPTYIHTYIHHVDLTVLSIFQKAVTSDHNLINLIITV